MVTVETCKRSLLELSSSTVKSVYILPHFIQPPIGSRFLSIKKLLGVAFHCMKHPRVLLSPLPPDGMNVLRISLPHISPGLGSLKGGYLSSGYAGLFS